jgi:hypothetical protein
VKQKLLKAIPPKEFEKWQAAAEKLNGNNKGNLSEYIRRAATYCAEKKIKL